MLQHLQFDLRRRILGQLILRRGLPHVHAAQEDVNECTYYTRLLTAATTPDERAAVGQVVDVGCRNWSYAQAVADCFPHADLIGVEVDGYRRYWNMFRRIDYARAHAASTHRPSQVILGDFRDLHIEPNPRGATLFCFLFPFVTPYPCLRWGLPRRFADYPSLLRHALQHPHAQFLCVHQGDWEADEARELYADLGLHMRDAKLAPDAWAGLWDSPHDNWVFFSTGVHH